MLEVAATAAATVRAAMVVAAVLRVALSIARAVWRPGCEETLLVAKAHPLEVRAVHGAQLLVATAAAAMTAVRWEMVFAAATRA